MDRIAAAQSQRAGCSGSDQRADLRRASSSVCEGWVAALVASGSRVLHLLLHRIVDGLLHAAANVHIFWVEVFGGSPHLVSLCYFDPSLSLSFARTSSMLKLSMLKLAALCRCGN